MLVVVKAVSYGAVALTLREFEREIIVRKRGELEDTGTPVRTKHTVRGLKRP